MEVTGKREGGIIVVEIRGRMDASTAPQFETKCYGFLEDGEKRIVIDFTGLEYISSAGLRSILSIGKKLKNRGGSLSVCQMSGMVQEVFDISGFTSIFPAYDTVEDALEGL